MFATSWTLRAEIQDFQFALKKKKKPNQTVALLLCVIEGRGAVGGASHYLQQGCEGALSFQQAPFVSQKLGYSTY